MIMNKKNKCLLVQNGVDEITVGCFDENNVLDIDMTDNVDNENSITNLTPDQVNEIITHLVEQLEDIKEPVKVFEQFKK